MKIVRETVLKSQTDGFCQFFTVSRHPMRNMVLMFSCSCSSCYPASQGRLLHNLATFCLGCCRGIRKTGWTLVSGDNMSLNIKQFMYLVWHTLIFSVPLTPTDAFFSHPFLEPSSTIKKCKHKGHIPTLEHLLYYAFTSSSLKSMINRVFICPQHVQCQSPAPPMQWRTVPVAAPHASATTPLLWVWYYFINPHSEEIILPL